MRFKVFYNISDNNNRLTFQVKTTAAPTVEVSYTIYIPSARYTASEFATAVEHAHVDNRPVGEEITEANKALVDEGYTILSDDELNLPSSPEARGWLETGDLDHRGHQLQDDLPRVIPAEIERETVAIKSRYADPQPRMFPVAVTFLVPEKLRKG